MAARKRRSTTKKKTTAKKFKVMMMKAGKRTTVDTLPSRAAANKLKTEVKKTHKSATVWVKEV